MAITFQNNSPGGDPSLIHRSLTTLIRGDLCYSIELDVVAQPGRCPAIGKFPQTVLNPTESVNPRSSNLAGATTAAAPAPPPGADASALRTPIAQEKSGVESATGNHSSQSTPAAEARSNVCKQAKVLDMITRSSGATLSEMRAITGWQAHSIRALVSTLAKRDRLRIRSSKNQAGELVHRIESPTPPLSSS
jgi:hypothetical protein